MGEFYDAIIIGAGPAGLSGAIYLARARYRVLVLEKDRIGGQITITSEVVNYPGVERTDGTALTETMRRQAVSFGAEFASACVTGVERVGHVIEVSCADGTKYECASALLALGASPRKVGFTGEEQFRGRGVAYCATCDGEFFTGRPVIVIGGGFAAVEEAMFLTRYASSVTMLVRRDSLSCAKSVADKLADYPTINVRYNTEIEEVHGESFATCMRIRNNRTGTVEECCADDDGPLGIFVFAGYEPATGFVKDALLLNEQGYIVTDQSQMTSCEGIFAAGDVCIKSLRQVVTAVSDGAIAATSMEKYITLQREQYGVRAAELPAQRAAAEASAPRAQDEDKHAPASDIEPLISDDMKEQICGVFDKLEGRGLIEAVITGDALAAEIESFVREFDGLHQNVTVKITHGSDAEHSFIAVGKDGEAARIRYYSVPGGHEFTSFILAVYNAVGPGQDMGEPLRNSITALKPHKLQVMVTLSCTNCPEVVKSTQRIASLNSNIEAEMYDLSKFPDMKTKHNIMAVPCMIIDGKQLCFGKKGLAEIVGILS